MRLAKLHLVAERVAQKRRMVLDLRNCRENVALRALERHLVEIAEAVVVVSEPEPEHHGVSELRRLVELGLRAVSAPGAERVAADLLQQRF